MRLVKEIVPYCNSNQFFRSVFNFDVTTLDYQQYMSNWVIGARQFLLKLDDSSIPEAKQKYRVLFWVDFSVRIAFFAAVGFLAYRLKFADSSVAELNG